MQKGGNCWRAAIAAARQQSEGKITMDKGKFTLVIPSLDPDEKLAFVVRSALKAGIEDIILVDDGSRAENKHYFLELEKLSGVTLLVHEGNRGKGAALKTAFTYFLTHREGFCGVVTADGDGQHRIEDILACAGAMEEGEPAVILGCRNFSLETVPPKSRFGNRITSLVFRLFCGMKISDTQTGLRAIPTVFLKDLMEAEGSRYEYETNMLLLMGQKRIPYREVLIETIYYDDNRASHFRPIRDSFRVYSLIVKYSASSLISSGVDLLSFYLLGLLFFPGGTGRDIFLCTFFARVLSSMANFLMNRRFVFESQSGFMRTLFRYLCIAVPVMILSWLCVRGISDVLHIKSQLLRTVFKIPVDIMLFLFSFRMQRRWVFAEKEK